MWAVLSYLHSCTARKYSYYQYDILGHTFPSFGTIFFNLNVFSIIVNLKWCLVFSKCVF